MAEVLGPQTLLNMALPTGWDATKLAQWMTRDGITYGELANQLSLALGGFNQELVNNWGWLFFLTEEFAMEYEDGGSVTVAPDITDIDKPEALQGSTIGHMIDLRVYGQGIGGTRRYFRDSRSAKINAAINAVVKRLQWRFEKKLLDRWFLNSENTIGTAGYDVPFVRGTGGAVDFAPPAWGGEAFTTSHDHYLGVDSDSKTAADSLNEMAETLQEHGHNSPYTALIARADVATFRALTDFVEVVDPVISTIDQGDGTTGRFFSVGQRPDGLLGFYQGLYGLVEIRFSNRVPTLWSGMVKSYGTLDTRNAIAVRTHPQTGFGAYIVPETVPDDDYPVKQLDVEMEYGVGLGMDRTAGAAAYLHTSGTWSNPTIT